MREGQLMLFIFASTREVISAEKLLRDAGMSCQIIPVPRSISSECGMGIRIDGESAQRASVILEKYNPKRHEE